MGNLKLKSKEIAKLGFEKGSIAGLALQLINQNFKHEEKVDKIRILEGILQNPGNFKEDEIWAPLAQKLIPKESPRANAVRHELRDEPLPYKVFGAEGIRDGTFYQMETAMRLPITAAGALMPDAHKGSGVPVGGVLATRNAIIPYAVGLDIGCRMCLSVFDLPSNELEKRPFRLENILRENSRFGSGVFGDPMDDPVLERSEFKDIKVVGELKDKAWRQIGTSGSGNHFVEFGLVTLETGSEALELAAGEYFALLTHSGSRGFGATLAGHYQEVARTKCRLPRTAKHLSWLDMNTEEGQEYWLAMNLAGDYASACHDHIHRRISRALGRDIISRVENHHNFAWKEQLADGSEVYVHRKGATPAGEGVLGIIPGSMTDPGFIVQGKGNPSSLYSASHGAGRRLSRKESSNSVTRHYLRKYLREKRVTLIGGGPEEAPMAYKNIHEVMDRQKDLVEVLGTFLPKVVRMDKG